MLKKNDIVRVTITDQSDTGDGIGKADGFPLFVRHAVIGDTADVIVTRLKKTYGFAAVKEIITPSAFRVSPPCESWKRCGGCQLQPLSYEAQLAYKTNKVLQALERIGGFTAKNDTKCLTPCFSFEVEECAASENILRYRNKVQYPVGYDKNGGLTAGFYAARSHEIIPCTDCVTGPEEFPKILKTVLDWMKEYKVSAYEESSKKGTVRHVFLRKSFAYNKIHVCIIINAKKLPFQDELIRSLMIYPQITGISYSVNTSGSNVIMGESVRTVWGERSLKDCIGETCYQLDPLSFYQVNPVQTKRLYDCVREFAGLTGTENVWDIYCGIGSISLYLAEHAKSIIGIEVTERAIRDAKVNMQLNGISNAQYFAGDAAEVFPKLYGEMSTPRDVVILDPPRKGCDPAVIEAVLKSAPAKVIYVSCNPATLARDLKLFCAGPFCIQKVCPYDMFPMSCHVESCVLLQRVSNTRPKAITLDVEMEDYYRIKGDRTND